MTKLDEPMARSSTAGVRDTYPPPEVSASPPKSHPGLWIAITAILALAIGAGIWFFVFRSSNHATASSSAEGAPGGAGGAGGAGAHGTPVVAATVRRGDIGRFFVGLGAVQPFYSVTVHTRVDGEIMAVKFDEGQSVKKGDALIEIDPRPYEATLLQAQGQLAKDQAQLTNAQLNVQRDKEAGTAISQQQLTTDVATLQTTQASLKVDEAAINAAQLNVTYSHITSPIDGRIGLRLVDPGNIVHAADTGGMAVINQLQPISVVFTLPEDAIPRVQQAVKLDPHLAVEAYDRSGRTHIADGTLETIDNQVDPASGTFKCKAVFANKDLTLFPNQFVNVRLKVATEHNAIIAPASGVQQGPDSTFAYVVQPDSTVALRNVKVTALAGNEILVADASAGVSREQTLIESGLSPGDVIVTDGVDRLVQGAKVQVSRQGAHGAATSMPVGSGASAATSPSNMASSMTSDTTGETTGAAGADQGQTQHHHHHHASTAGSGGESGADASSDSTSNPADSRGGAGNGAAPAQQ